MCKIRNFVAELYSLKAKNYLNCGGSNLIGVKKIIAYFFANSSNLLLHVNIDIILCANGLFLAFMLPVKRKFGNNEKLRTNVKIAR